MAVYLIYQGEVLDPERYEGIRGQGVTQLRCEPRARELHDQARQRRHSNTEAMRVLKRRLSDVVYRHMISNLETQPHRRTGAA